MIPPTLSFFLKIVVVLEAIRRNKKKQEDIRQFVLKQKEGTKKRGQESREADNLPT